MSTEALVVIGLSVLVVALIGACVLTYRIARRQGYTAGLAVERCHHRWKVTGASYLGPGGQASGFVSPAIESRIFFGATIVSDQCGICGDTRTRTLEGKAHLPGMSWSKAGASR